MRRATCLRDLSYLRTDLGSPSSLLVVVTPPSLRPDRQTTIGSRFPSAATGAENGQNVSNEPALAVTLPRRGQRPTVTSPVADGTDMGRGRPQEDDATTG